MTKQSKQVYEDLPEVEEGQHARAFVWRLIALSGSSRLVRDFG
jgi:hypothetical protein